jgi:hypothetical protein
MEKAEDEKAVGGVIDNLEHEVMGTGRRVLSEALAKQAMNDIFKLLNVVKTAIKSSGILGVIYYFHYIFKKLA